MTGISRSLSRVPCGASSFSSISACTRGQAAVVVPESFTTGCCAFNEIPIETSYECFMTAARPIQVIQWMSPPIYANAIRNDCLKSAERAMAQTVGDHEHHDRTGRQRGAVGDKGQIDLQGHQDGAPVAREALMIDQPALRTVWNLAVFFSRSWSERRQSGP